MAIIWEKVISILAGNLNSGRSYLITAVVEKQAKKKKWLHEDPILIQA